MNGVNMTHVLHKLSGEAMKRFDHYLIICLHLSACLTFAGCNPATRPPEAPTALVPAVASGKELGASIYAKNCASCHDFSEATRAPAPTALKELGFRTIRLSLTDGKMREQGALLTSEEQDAVAIHLAGEREIDDSWLAKSMCQSARRGIDTAIEPTMATFGINRMNHRHLTAAEAGLDRAGLASLELAWAFGFPGNASMRSQPVIVGDTLFIAAVDTGRLYALDIAGEPCIEWVYQAEIPLRTSMSYGDRGDGRKVLAMGDTAARTLMVDAQSGALLWLTDVKVNEKSKSATTGTPVIHGGKVYVPISSFEQSSLGANPDYECCRSHGAVTALDAMTGQKVWTAHTMEEATPRNISRVGTQQWGPSGAPIWSTPAIDEKRGVLYVGTGQNNSIPPTDTSDAILALDLEDGSLRWKFQATRNDIFLTGCMFERDGPNCPPEWSLMADHDFGASVVIAQRNDGRDILLAGQKSGKLWALDPDDSGKLLWSTDVGPGGALGGIHWGMALAGNRVYVPVNRMNGPGEDPEDTRKTGMHAVDVNTGKVLWSYYNEPDCTGPRKEYMPTCDRAAGLSAAALAIDAAVVHGGLDGFLRVFDGETGAVLFRFDTATPFATVNGVEGHGGSIDNASIAAGNGMLFVGSGYSLVGSQAGNVLLAFRQKGSK
ncbi:MAG: cytochrome C oxidase Cbb3 [Gammaproteobacteria bacterium]|nr:MAG: cytochrome C oxidase Cbb3 [Gammaproteobacteria bacterium]